MEYESYWFQNFTLKVISAEAELRCLSPFKVMLSNQYDSYSILEMFISVSRHVTKVQQTNYQAIIPRLDFSAGDYNLIMGLSHYCNVPANTIKHL